jgi:hypothetical protein
LVAQLALAPGAVCQRGGVFTSTEQAQAVRVGFDYVMLVDPSDTTSLRESLIVSEIMYNPIGGDPYEYVELWNKSSGTIDLDGVRFSEGISCTFQPTVLAPGERIVIAKDLAAFASRYGLEGIRLAANSYSGKLDNGGERLTLVDRDGRQILSFTYGDGGRWPGRPDGFGSSLELVDPSASLDDPDNWRSSAEYNGSPGREGTGPLRTVVINEVLAHSDLPLEDAIELCNPSPNPVDIGGWFLSDDRADYQKYRIPFNTVVPAGGYIVFYEEQFNTNNTLKPFALSSAHGDEIYLVAADLQGNLTAFADAVSFDASANGVSFGRYPDGLGPLVPMALLTFGTDVLPGDPPERITEFRTGPGAPNAEPKVGPVVISQIMYNPSDGFDEYIELSNITDLPVPLFDPAAATNRWRLADAIDYTMPAGVTLGPQERVFVVGISPVTFRAKYQVPQDVRVFGPWRGSLDNAGEYLELLAPDSPQVLPPDAGFVPYYAVDAVEYDNRYPWPTLADGRGAALSRIELTQYGNDPANWRAIVAGEDQDSDGDGMPDEWEQANGLDPLAREDAWQDKDGDGMTNLAEYLSGTDPRDPASCLRLEVKSVTSDTIVLQFTAVADKSYTVEYRDSIQQGAWTRLMSIQAQPVTADREATDSLTGATSARFYRLITPAQH